MGHTYSVTEFTQIPNFEDITKVAAGSGFSLFVNSEGNLFSCGQKGVNAHLSKLGDVLSPRLIKAIEEEVTYVDCGVEHAAAVTSSGKLYTWGSNTFKQLGHGSSLSTSKIMCTPKLVSALEEVKVINVSCSKGLKHCQTA